MKSRLGKGDILVQTADSAANTTIRDVIGNKTDTIAGDSIYALLGQVLVAVGGEADQLRVEQSQTGTVEEDGMVTFGIGLMDIDTGAVASGSIDITGISAVLNISTGGAAFAPVGTQPTFAKAAGLVSVDYRFLTAEWANGDMYKLVVSGITCTVGADTAYVPALTWSGTVQEGLNVEAKIDDVIADITSAVDEPPTANSLQDTLHKDGSYTYNNTTDSLEAIRDNMDTLNTADQVDLDAIIVDITSAVDEPPTANSLQDLLHKDGSYTYDNTTDSNEAIADAISSGTLEIEADAGTTSTNIIDAAALTQATNDWFKGATLVSLNGQNAGQARPIVSFDTATDSVDVFPAFLNTPDAGDDFFLISSWRPHVLDQQPDVAVSTNANIAAVDIFDLNTAGVTFVVNNLRLKCADPGANTVTLTLYELINDASVAVDTFDITTANFGTYFSLYDMFSVQQLAGDDIQITLSCDADGNHAVTGQYQYAQAYTA